MNKEELLEMINSTINENGAGMITGKALNLALTEIVNAMGTGSGAGGEKLYMVMGEAEPMPTSVMPTEGVSYEIPSFCTEHNKEVYNKLRTVWNNGEELEGIIYVDWTHWLRGYGINTNEYRVNLPIRWGIDSYGNLMFTFSENSVKWNNYGSTSAYSTYYLWSDGYFYNYQENSGAE